MSERRICPRGHEYTANRKKCPECCKERSRQWRTKQREKGLCARCGTPMEPGSIHRCCAACVAHSAATRQHNRGPGRCGCGKPLLDPDYKTCSHCRQRQHEYIRDYKRRALAGYGGHCACCGEQIPAFLTIDHIHDDGAEHRRTLSHGTQNSGSTAVYRWLIRNEFPEGYRVLCFSCNSGRQINGGTCPHRKIVNLDEYRRRRQDLDAEFFAETHEAAS